MLGLFLVSLQASVRAGLLFVCERFILRSSRLVAGHVFANAHTALPGVAPPPHPALALPPSGRSSQVTGLAVRAPAWTGTGPDGGWDPRPSSADLACRSALLVLSLLVQSLLGRKNLHTPPLALTG